MAVLKAPYCRVSIWSGDSEPDHVFVSGRNILAATVQLGEGNRSSNCQVSVYDPGFKTSGAIRQSSLEQGGLAVPDSVFTRQAVDTDSGADVDISGGGDIPEGTTGDDLALAIVRYFKAKGHTNDLWLASILGTCQKESSMGIYTKEIDDGSNYSYLAPEQEWHGRGLVQTTWKSNYQKMKDRYGVDFIADPNLMEQLRYAVPILVDGMIEGYFTAYALKTLGNYVSESNARAYFQATRLIVNPGEGGSRLREYVTYCERWYTRIKSGFGGQGVANIGPAQLSENAGTVAIASHAVPNGAREIQVELGWNDSPDVYSFSFWLTGVSTQGGPPEVTTITGQSIRYSLARAEKTSRVAPNMSLRMWAKHIESTTGTTIFVTPGPGADQIANVRQKRESDFNLLVRMAAAQGYVVKEERDRITVEPIKSGEVVTLDQAAGVKFRDTSDQADQQRRLESIPPLESIPDGRAVGSGYETTLEIPYPTTRRLGIKPGLIAVLGADVVPRPFARRYRIKTVRWTYGNSGLSGRVGLYLPVAIDPPVRPAGESAGKAVGAYGNLGPVPQLAGRSNPYMLIQATGNRLTLPDGRPGEVELVISWVGADGTVDANKGQLICVSGHHSNQRLNQVNIAGSLAPCPPGTFRLEQAVSPSGPVKPGATLPANPNDFSQTLGPYWIGVTGTPGRSAIGYHTDRNRKTSPGTAGCIGLLWTVGDQVGTAGPSQAQMNRAMFTACQWRNADNADTVVIDYSNWPKSGGGHR